MFDPSGHPPRYRLLDAWRGVACLMVVIHHSGFCLNWLEASSTDTGSPARRLAVGFVRVMDLGVPIFFVISGYCIAASLESHRRRGGSSWHFLARRVGRIYPPYWVALLCFALTTWGLDRLGLHRLHDGQHSLFLAAPGKLNLAQWLGNLTLTETWRPRAFGGGYSLVFTRVAWTLCFEEQFYFVCFLVLLIVPRRLPVALAALTLFLLPARAFAYDTGWLMHYRGTFLELWHEFAVGLAVYWRLVLAPPGRGKLGVEAGLVALLAIGIAWSFWSTAAAAAFGLILIALRRLDDALASRRWMKPLTACGLRSYSIYLIHTYRSARWDASGSTASASPRSGREPSSWSR